MDEQENTTFASNPTSGSAGGGNDIMSQLASAAIPAFEKYGPGIMAQITGVEDDDDAIAESPAEPTPASNVAVKPSAHSVPEDDPAPSDVTAEAPNGIAETIKEQGMNFLSSQMEQLLTPADAEGSTSDAQSDAAQPAPASAGSVAVEDDDAVKDDGGAPKK